MTEKEEDFSKEIERHILRKYQPKRRVGKGAYGIVWEAKEIESGKTIALKKIFNAFQNDTDAQRTYREIMFLFELNQFNHENIIKLLDVLKAENDKDVYLVFVHMDTNLDAVIKSNILEDIHKRYILYQSVKALKFLHSGGLVHRDMKPSNILLDEQCHCKLCDFGLARSVAEIEDSKEHVLTDYVATRWYRAPEILFGSSKYSKAVDMWSIGCMLGELMGGKPVFSGSSTQNQIQIIISATGYPSDEDIASMRSKYTRDILEGLEALPSQPLMDKFRHIPSDAQDLLTQLLQFNPDRRLTAEQALEHPYFAQFHATGAGEERSCPSVLRISMDDDTKFATTQYRKNLYDKILDKRKEIRARKLQHRNELVKSQKTATHTAKPKSATSRRVTPKPHLKPGTTARAPISEAIQPVASEPVVPIASKATPPVVSQAVEPATFQPPSNDHVSSAVVEPVAVPLPAPAPEAARPAIMVTRIPRRRASESTLPTTLAPTPEKPKAPVPAKAAVRSTPPVRAGAGSVIAKRPSPLKATAIPSGTAISKRPSPANIPRPASVTVHSSPIKQPSRPASASNSASKPSSIPVKSSVRK